MGTVREQAKQVRELPRPDGDFYGIKSVLSEEDGDVLRRVRSFMEENVAPIINDYWMRDEFPYEILPGLKELRIAGTAYEG